MGENKLIPEIRVYAPSDFADRRSGNLQSNQNNGDAAILENTFQMRNINLANFPTNSSSNRITYRTAIFSRVRAGATTNTAKSLNILRQTLQNRINVEIHEIMQKYLHTYFEPAAENIKQNFGVNAISEHHLQAVCRQVLEEAKSMYFGPLPTRCNSPATGTSNVDGSDHLSDTENVYASLCKRRNRRDSDSNSESGSFNSCHLKPLVVKKKRMKTSPGRGRPPAVKVYSKTANEPMRREGPQWDPNRLTSETRFVLGSKANKALGFGATRGRLYTKHATLFRYIGDQEDKQWLHERRLMPLAGGRAYLLIREDIQNLLDSEEYKNAPGVNPNDMGQGFTVPETMLVKMRAVMEAMRSNGSHKRTDISRKPKTPSVSSTPVHETSSFGSASNQPESRGVSPADDLDYVNTSGVQSTNPSPFSISGIGLSPNEENQVSPLASDVSSTTLNEMQL